MQLISIKLKVDYCHQPGFLDDLCRRNKFHISKTVRLGLDVASKFLEDPNVKIIYVARDPRGNNKLRFVLLITSDALKFVPKAVVKHY